jgi:hypothetical protein
LSNRSLICPFFFNTFIIFLCAFLRLFYFVFRFWVFIYLSRITILFIYSFLIYLYYYYYYCSFFLPIISLFHLIYHNNCSTSLINRVDSNWYCWDCCCSLIKRGGEIQECLMELNFGKKSVWEENVWIELGLVRNK